MLIVETIAKVRRAYFLDGKSIKAICRELRLSRKVVRKVIRSGETSFSYERAVQPRPIGQWTATLDELLEATAAKPTREQLTLIRLFEDLRARGYAKAHRHPELTDQTIWEAFEAERQKLVPYTERFDGFHSVPASISKTCLVRFDNNKYSVMASAVGRPVEIHAYADRVVIRQDGRIVGEQAAARQRPRRVQVRRHAPSTRPWSKTSPAAALSPSSATSCWWAEPILIHDAHLAMSLEGKGLLIWILS